MKARIKNDSSIANQVKDQIVDVEKHPKFSLLYRFQFGGETWQCSKDAFEIIEEEK